MGAKLVARLTAMAAIGFELRISAQAEKASTPSLPILIF
jgi:hypothetical protein